MEKPWEATVREAQQGDNRAFARLVQDFAGYIYHVAYSLLWQPEDAEDVAQEAFLKAYTNLDRLRDPRAFPAWLGRIALNLARNRRQAEAAGPLLEPLPDPDTALAARSSGPEESILARETRSDVQAAVAALPEHYRTALLLRIKANLPYDEIADILDIPVGTVRSRIHSARRLLAEALAVSHTPTALQRREHHEE